MPQKQKLSLEEKLEIIRDYLEGTISKSEAARRGGVARDTIFKNTILIHNVGKHVYPVHTHSHIGNGVGGGDDTVTVFFL